ncbi:hypothetical protein DFQ11_101149 [Winogradskyella epiphytica]|uniref:Outer membrane protein with beta-barrel domain n=2 Tax=Winogradskyella epiphytica TaxID=262005 RepID=A0A2V4Y1M5_9FLAO|nr:hypothetical protein DFQ11_101149 [Winogradskyella epiphytica]
MKNYFSMKKIFLIILLVAFSLSSFAQRHQDQWFFSIGVNAINDVGTKNPYKNSSDWAFKFPLSAAVEFNWAENIAIEQSLTFNGFNKGDFLDPYPNAARDYNYISLDTHLKYYFGDLLLGKAPSRNAEWFDIYVNGGLGFSHIDETNISANVGGGVLFWLNREKSFGIRLQTIAKFALNHSDSDMVNIDNNHFQHHIQFVFKL